MSEDTARNEAGQFTAAEPLYGLAGVEADQGYIQRPPESIIGGSPEQPAEEYGSDEESLRKLARQKWGDSSAEPTDRTLRFLDNGEKVPDNWAQTVEQAATDLSNVHRWEKEAFEAEHLAKVAEDVDKARAEKIKGDPKLAEHYGIEDGKDAKEAKEAEKAITPEVRAMVETGIDEDVAIALTKPQVRQAIAEEFSRAESIKAEYSQGLQTAHQFGQAALLEIVPELSHVPLEQWGDGLNMLAQVDPARAQTAVNMLQRVGQIQAAQQQAAQQRAAIEHQQIEAWAKAEDARLEEMGVKFTRESVDEVAAYAKSLGIEREALGRAMLDHPILRSAPVQKMMADAAKWHAIQRAPAKAAPPKVPTVQKPGTARSAGDRDASEIMSLRQKAAASGSPEDAFKLYSARKKARN